MSRKAGTWKFLNKIKLAYSFRHEVRLEMILDCSCTIEGVRNGFKLYGLNTIGSLRLYTSLVQNRLETNSRVCQMFRKNIKL